MAKLNVDEVDKGGQAELKQEDMALSDATADGADAVVES